MSGEEFHVMKTSAESRRLIEQMARQSRTVEPLKLEPIVQTSFGQVDGEQVREYLRGSPSGHTLIGPRHATASLPDDDYAGWHWKCSCGAEASPWIQNWPQSADEAREEWRLHFD